MYISLSLSLSLDINHKSSKNTVRTNIHTYNIYIYTYSCKSVEVYSIHTLLSNNSTGMLSPSMATPWDRPWPATPQGRGPYHDWAPAIGFPACWHRVWSRCTSAVPVSLSWLMDFEAGKLWLSSKGHTLMGNVASSRWQTWWRSDCFLYLTLSPSLPIQAVDFGAYILYTFIYLVFG